MRYYVKIHRSSENCVVSICDEDVLGYSYEGRDLFFEVNEDFYKGDLVTEDVVLNFLEGSNNLNLVGNRIIELSLRKGFIDEDCVRIIGDVKHALRVL